MAIRLMLSHDISDYKSALERAGLSYEKVKDYIDDPSSAVKEVTDDTDTYGGIDPRITEENALYLVLTNYITTTLSEPEVNGLYDDVCAVSNESIRYVSVDMSMIPLYYGDNSYFATIAYLGSYSIGAYGAPTKFFSYDTYSGYAAYTDAMYETFFWRALIGMSPAEAGYTSLIAYINALGLSDGSVKADPGYGLPGYKIAYWHVYYNPDNNATASSDGWVDMEALGPDGAIALQNSQGGMINYVNGVVVLEYDPSSLTDLSGTVNFASSSGNAGAKGIQVSVFVESEVSPTGYAKRSTVLTDADGRYTISVPNDGSRYYVVFSSGTSTLATGSVIETRWDMTSSNANLTIQATSLSGSVIVKNDPFQAYKQEAYVVIEGQSSGMKYQMNIDTSNRADTARESFRFDNIVPDVYKVTVYSPSGTIINTGTVTVTAGANTGYQISATSGTLTVTVTTDVGAPAQNGTVVEAKDTLTGVVYSGTVTDGKAVIYVVPGTYTVYAGGSKVSINNPSSTVSNGGSSTASLTVFDAKNISVSGAPSGSLINIMSYGFTASSTTSTFAIPQSGGSSIEQYTAYALSGNNVYYGVSSSSSISMTSSAGYNVSGILKDYRGNPFSGTVSFIKADGAAVGATFIFMSDADGKFSVTLPAGTYTLHAYGASSATITTITVSEDTDLGDIATKRSRDLSIILNYRTNMSSASTRGIPFVDVKFSVEIEDVTYDFFVKTNTTGRAQISVPEGLTVKASSPGFNTGKFYMKDMSHEFAPNSVTSTTWALADKKPTSNPETSTGWVKTVSVSASPQLKLTLYNSSSTVFGLGGESLSAVIPGQYNALIDTGTEYFSGTVYIYPGHTGGLDITTTNFVKVTLNASENDEITVVPTDEEEGTYHVDEDNPLIYYLQRGKSFYFMAVSGDGETEQIAYASVSNITSPVTLNLNNKADKAVITGYAGVNADGTLIVTYGGVSIPFEITDGTFEITVPAGTAIRLDAKMSQTIDDKEYAYSGTTNMSAAEVVDEAKIYFHSTTTSSSPVSTLDLKGSNFNFANGRGSFNLEITNTTNSPVTYSVTAGSAWILDKAYTVTVNAGQKATVTIQGRYDPATVGAGDPNLSVTATSINGTSAGTYVLDASAFSSTGPGEMYVDISGIEGASADAVSSFEYMYAVTITNNDSYLKTVSISAKMPPGSSANWSMVFSDENGGIIVPSNGSNTFSVNGYGKTTIYVKLMYRDASETSVPDIELVVSTSMTNQTLKTNSGGSSDTANRSVTFKNVSAKEAVIDTEDTSASGNNIFNEPTPVPMMTWVLLALTILTFIAMIWFGIRKGVFVRRR
jgi:hypothetical protein